MRRDLKTLVLDFGEFSVNILVTTSNGIMCPDDKVGAEAGLVLSSSLVSVSVSRKIGVIKSPGTRQPAKT